MNCKPGDLAIVVKSWAGNEGKIVRCIKLDTERSFFDNVGPDGVTPPEPIWIIDIHLRGCDGSFSNYIADSQLRPIRDPGDDAVDQVVLKVGKPREETCREAMDRIRKERSVA